MSNLGLLDKLPDLGELEQVRDLVQGGLDEAWQQVRQPDSLLEPLTGALTSLRDQVPDVAGLLEPLADQRNQIAGTLPSGLDQQVEALAPLLDQVGQLVDTSVLGPFIQDLRAGRSINEIAQDRLQAVLEQQLLGQLPNITGAALPAGAQQSVDDLLSAAGNFGAGTPDPSALADFLGEQILGVPMGPLAEAAGVHDRFLGVIDGLLAASNGDLSNLEETLATSILTAAESLEALDPGQASDWQAALETLQEAEGSLDDLLGSLQALPGTIYQGLGQINLEGYKADLQGALQALPGVLSGSASGLGRSASLESLADTILQPLEEMTEILAQISPAQFTAALGASLDELLAMFDRMVAAAEDNPVFDFLDDLTGVVGTVADAIGNVRSAIDSAIQAVVQAVGQVLDAFQGIQAQVEAAFQALQQAIQAVDIDALVAAVEDILDQIDNLLAQIPLPDLKDTLDQALTTIEQLVTAVSEATEGALQQAEGLLSALAKIEFGPLVDPVIEAMAAIRDAVSAIEPGLLPDALRSQLGVIVDAFRSEFGSDPSQWFQDNVIDYLGHLFDEAVEAVRQLAEGLQAKLGEFAAALGQIDPAKLLEPVTQIYTRLNDAIAGLNSEKLLAPAHTLLDEALAQLQALSPEALFAPLEQAFEQEILEPVQSFKPSDLLQPLSDAFQPIDELLGNLDFADAFGELGQTMADFVGSTQGSLTDALDFSGLPGAGAVAGQVQPLLGLLKPTTSMDEWTQAMDGILNAYRPAAILEPIQEALAPVESALSGAADELLVSTFGHLKAVANVTRTSAMGDLFADRMEQVAQALESHVPEALASGLDDRYTHLLAALEGIDPASVPEGLRPQYDAARAAIAGLEPSAALNGFGEALALLPFRVRQAAARPVDLSDLEEEFGTALDQVAGLLPGFVFGELTADSIQQGLAAFSPTSLIGRIDQAFDAFRTTAERFAPAIQVAVEGFVENLGEKLAALSPAALLERFNQVFQPMRDLLQQLSPQAIGQALDEAHAQLVEQLAQIHPRVIRQTVQALFDEALSTLEELKQGLLEAVGTAIDQVLARLRETLKALDPQALIVGLGNFFELIQKALEGLTLAPLLDKLIEVFDRLRTDLVDVLQRTTAAFGQMMEQVEALSA